MPVKSLVFSGRLLQAASNSFRHTRSATTVPARDPKPESSDPALPDDVADRLKSLSTDILEFVMDAKLCEVDMTSSTSSLKNLQDMAKYYFEKSGKLVRPAVTLLMASACNNKVKELGINVNEESVVKNQYRIAMVSEMIHTASLIHDDVIDEAHTRRGKPTANVKWGNKRAVLGGDRILARATKLLCMTKDPEVITTMASIVDNLVDGELMQLEVNPDADAVDRFQHYMQKTYYKTASLFANSCLSVAALSECPVELRQKSFEFGRNFGLAFQLVDDMLDYVASSAELGKPSVADLKQGLATAPVLFAAQEYPELNTLINRRFGEKGDVEQAYRIVIGSTALSQTRELINHHCDSALALLCEVSQCPSGQSLAKLTASQSQRER